MTLNTVVGGKLFPLEGSKCLGGFINKEMFSFMSLGEGGGIAAYRINSMAELLGGPNEETLEKPPERIIERGNSVVFDNGTEIRAS